MKISSSKYLIFDNALEVNWKYIIKKIAYPILMIFNKFIMNLYHPVTLDNKKYQVAICAIFKNEAPYLREWIEFHRLVGIEHFYLYNNCSEDFYQEVLQPYIDEGVVTFIEWPYQQAQMQAYQNCIERFRRDVQWLGFIDLDEFVIPKDKDTVGEVLAPFTKNRSAVLLYWRLYGTSGKIDRPRRGLVTEDFTVCWPKFSEVGKCFLNMNYDFLTESGKKSMLHHHPVTYYGFMKCHPVNLFDNICYGSCDKLDSADVPMQINHYFTKSYKEYAEKKSKGDVYFKNNPHDMDYFYEHEMKCQTVDYSAYKYLVKLKLAMENIL